MHVIEAEHLPVPLPALAPRPRAHRQSHLVTLLFPVLVSHATTFPLGSSARSPKSARLRTFRPQSEVAPTSMRARGLFWLRATFRRRVHSRRFHLGQFSPKGFPRPRGDFPETRPCKSEAYVLDAKRYELTSVQSSLSSDRPNRVLRSAGRRGFKVASDAHFFGLFDSGLPVVTRQTQFQGAGARLSVTDLCRSHFLAFETLERRLCAPGDRRSGPLGGATGRAWHSPSHPPSWCVS